MHNFMLTFVKKALQIWSHMNCFNLITSIKNSQKNIINGAGIYLKLVWQTTTEILYINVIIVMKFNVNFLLM